MPSDTSEPRPFLEQVESFFVATVQQGLALRPGDIEVARDWERRGVPFDVVRRGVADGVRRFLETAEPHQPLPGVLKYYRTFVEAEFRTWQRARVLGMGVAAAPRAVAPSMDLAERAIDVLTAWATQAGDVAARAVFQTAVDRIRSRERGRPIGDLLDALDDWIAVELLARTSSDASWHGHVAAALGAARQRGVGTAALADLERAAIRAAAAEYAGYSGLVDACLAGREEQR